MIWELWTLEKNVGLSDCRNEAAAFVDPEATVTLSCPVPTPVCGVWKGGKSAVITGAVVCVSLAAHFG